MLGKYLNNIQETIAMEMFNQPHSRVFGEKLQEILLSENFDTFYMIVAYVKESGVIRLKPFVEKFKSSGGIVKAVVGIDQKLTSSQGLALLMPLCDEIYVYHSENPMQTFHPKAYAFVKEDKKAIILIGSNNLTSGGLYTNYEFSSCHEYNLEDKSQMQYFNEFKKAFEFYSTPSKCSKNLSPELFKKMVEAGHYLSDEKEQIKRVFSKTGEMVVREKIFGSEAFKAPPRIQPVQKKLVAEKLKTPKEIEEILIISSLPKGNLVWEKKLNKSDILVAEGKTNPTGGLRLTQAKWKDDGKRISQTTYFREKLFGNFKWNEIRQKPKVYGAYILFNVTILGNDIGTHLLLVRHKPSGESKQGNYTTSISWGEIKDFITKQNLTGKTLKLYSPKEGQEPFFIEIN